MLRTAVAFAVLAVPLVACTGTGSGPGDDNATLVFGTDSGNFEVQLLRDDPNHSFGALTATVDGISLGAPTITPGGCDTNDPDPLGGGCSPAFATFEISPAALGGAVAADVTVTEGDQTFHFDSPEFFTPRAIALKTSLDQPLAAGATVAVSDGAASDQISGWLFAYTPDKGCFTVDANGTGAVSFDLDPADFDASCATVPAGTVVAAQMDLTLQAVPAQTCDGPDSLTCSQGDPWIQQTVAMQLQF